MLLSPSICRAVVAILLLPLVWSAAVAFLRMPWFSREREGWLSDIVEKLVLALLLASCAMGVLGIFAHWSPASHSGLSHALTLDFRDDVEPAPAAFSHAAPHASFPWLQAGISIFALAYAVGALIAISRLVRAHLRLWRIASSAQDSSDTFGEGVAVSEMNAPPFVAAGRTIVLPASLIAVLSPAQTGLVVAHERAHVQRGDSFYYALLAWVDALFWFNPFMRAQTERCRLAAELACDAAVTAAAPEMRRVYAQALLEALKHTAGNALQCAPAVFSTRIVGEHRMRIREIMARASSRRKRSAWLVSIAACVAAAPFAALQIAVAQTNSAQPVVQAAQASPLPSTGDAIFSVAPLSGKISSKFGPRADPRNGRPQFHNGVDFVAPEGAQIVAPAAGRVTRVEPNRSARGNALEIDHGGGLITQYWHLAGVSVAEGQQVAAGQEIARVGSTGLSTSPHLHFMIVRNGQPVDPETVLPHAP